MAKEVAGWTTEACSCSQALPHLKQCQHPRASKRRERHLRKCRRYISQFTNDTLNSVRPRKCADSQRRSPLDSNHRCELDGKKATPYSTGAKNDSETHTWLDPGKSLKGQASRRGAYFGGVCSKGSLAYRALSISITSATRASGPRNGNGLPVYLCEMASKFFRSSSGRRSTTRPRSCASR